MSDTDTQQSTEPLGKTDKRATARDQAGGENTDDPRWSDGQHYRHDGDGSGHQDGTRHGSPSFQLILSERALGRFELLYQRCCVRARTAFVLVNRRGEYHSFLPERRPTMGELLWKGTGTLYEVDMGLHWTSLELDLPSCEEAFRFHAVVNIEWRVINPAQVVRDGVNDVREALSPSLHYRLSMITRQFDVEDTAAAEKKAIESLTGQSIGDEYGLSSRVSLRMQMDGPTVIYAAKIREVQREITLERETQALRLLREEATTALITRRVERYRNIILAGDYDQFALQLAQNPDEAAAVIKMLRDERHDNRRNVVDFVTHLYDSGAIERYEINDQVRAALDWFKENINTVFRGPEQSTGISAQRNPDALPPTDIPEPDLPDLPQVDPVRPPGDATAHEAGKP